MAAKLEEAFDVKADLIPKGGGIFDVEIDDELVYSKHQTGTFPDEKQFLDQLKALNLNR